MLNNVRKVLRFLLVEIVLFMLLIYIFVFIVGILFL